MIDLAIARKVQRESVWVSERNWEFVSKRERERELRWLTAQAETKDADNF